MNTHINKHLCCIEGSSGIGEILDMVARCAPKLMKQGGGAVRREIDWDYRHLEEKDRAEIHRLDAEGLTTSEIAAKTGWSYKTVRNALPEETRRRTGYRTKRHTS